MTLAGLADIASVVGLAVGVVGFGYTIRQVSRTRMAAERAVRSLSIADLSGVISLMEEIRQHQRTGSWQILPDRYSAARRALTEVRASNPRLGPGDLQTVQAAITQLAGLAVTVEKHLAGEGPVPNVPRMNTIVARIVDALGEVLVRLNLEAGG